jgi:hypothetical protein
MQDKPVAIMTTIHAAAASYDWTVTREGINAGGTEDDPFARPFVHSNVAMVVGESAEIFGTAIMAQRMRHSRHRLLRDTWFLWQGIPIAAHIEGVSSWYGGTGPNSTPSSDHVITPIHPRFPRR